MTHDTARDKRAVRSIVDKYVAAITAGDEAAAARFTCRGKDGSLLWVGAACRHITVLDMEIHTNLVTGMPTARVRIQVEKKEPSTLILKCIDGTWCVWP